MHYRYSIYIYILYIYSNALISLAFELNISKVDSVIYFLLR